MEGNSKNILISMRSVKVTYDTKTSDRITFFIPCKQMATLGLVSTEQQTEINESIRTYTDGKDSIEWSMLGINNVLDICRALRKFKENNNTYFHKIKMTQYIYDTESFENRIIFYLDTKKMVNLNSDWECELIRDFDKHHVFHNFESVVINRSIKKCDKNNNNSNIKNDKILDTIETILEICDMQIMNMNKDLQNRENETCNIFVEPDGCLKRINNINKRLDSSIEEPEEHNSFDIQSYLNKMTKNHERARILNQDIQRVQNKLNEAKENIQKQEVEIKERETISDITMTKYEIDIAEMKKSQAKKKVDLIDDHGNGIVILETELCQANEMFRINTIMYNDCLNKLDSNELVKIINVLQIVGIVESSVNFQKQQLKQKENDSYSENVQGYDKDFIMVINEFDVISLIAANLSLNYPIPVSMELDSSNTISAAIGDTKIGNGAANVIHILMEENIFEYNTNKNSQNNNYYASMKIRIEDKLAAVLNYLLFTLDNKLCKNIEIHMQEGYGQTLVFDDSG